MITELNKSKHFLSSNIRFFAYSEVLIVRTLHRVSSICCEDCDLRSNAVKKRSYILPASTDVSIVDFKKRKCRAVDKDIDDYLHCITIHFHPAFCRSTLSCVVWKRRACGDGSHFLSLSQTHTHTQVKNYANFTKSGLLIGQNKKYKD